MKKYAPFAAAACVLLAAVILFYGKSGFVSSWTYVVALSLAFVASPLIHILRNFSWKILLSMVAMYLVFLGVGVLIIQAVSKAGGMLF